MIMSFWEITQKEKTKQSKKQLEKRKALSPCDAVVQNNEKDEYTVPDEMKQRVFSISSSRGNFAKNLVFAIFSPEERKG